LAAGLHRSNGASVRSAAKFALNGVIGVSILHLKGERTTRCVEAVNRIARNER
jgi:hypothetical protein